MLENETVAPETLKPAATAYQQRFREGRQATKQSLAVVAAALGKTAQYVSQFELGRNQLTVEQFLAACATLHLRTEWVLHGKGHMFEGAPPLPKQGRSARLTNKA